MARSVASIRLCLCFMSITAAVARSRVPRVMHESSLNPNLLSCVVVATTYAELVH